MKTRKIYLAAWIEHTNSAGVDRLAIVVSSVLSGLPEHSGFGNVHSLHQAMMRDTFGHLKGLVKQYAGTTVPTARKAVLTTLIYAWAGVEKVVPLSWAANDERWRSVA